MENLLQHLYETTEAPISVLDRPAIKHLINLLEAGATIPVKMKAVALLEEAARRQGHPDVIQEEGGIKPLINLLKTGSQAEQVSVASALGTLASGNSANLQIVKDGAIQPLINLLGAGSEHGTELAARALGNLASSDNNKFLIAKEGAIKPLIDVLETGSNSAKRQAARVLGNLAGNFSGIIAEKGAIKPLIKLLENGSDYLPAQAANTLANLTQSGLAEQIAKEGAIRPLTNLVDTGLLGVEHGERALWYLASNDNIKAQAGKEEAIKSLLSLLAKGSPAGRGRAAALFHRLEPLMNGDWFAHLGIQHVPEEILKMMAKFSVINLEHNFLQQFGTSKIVNMRLSVLNLQYNLLSEFPDIRNLGGTLQYLNISNNQISEIPEGVMTVFSHLEMFNIENNLLESIPTSLANITLKAVGNPLSTIVPAYRNDNAGIQHYLRVIQGKPMVQWQQIKLMLVGQQGVGKTTLVRTLQDPKYKCDTNISTNGINIVSLTLTRPAASLFSIFSQTQPEIQFNAWDFGGQEVFHSTHRLFVTNYAMYVILYDASRPSTIARIKYWIEQVGSINDLEGTKPILIVGTHADKVSKLQQSQLNEKIQKMYATSKSHTRSQIQGHFMISMTAGAKGGLSDLQAKLIDLALHHPKIGIGKVQVPQAFSMIEREFTQLRKGSPFVKWEEYSAIASGEEEIKDITTMLHDTGLIVWHDVPKLREVVVIDPQWLADSLAGVVSFITQMSAYNGMTQWHKMKQSLRLKVPSTEIHGTILALLESFEIVYKMRMSAGIADLGSHLHDDQMFFVPSLLLPFINGASHPSIQYWHQIEIKYTFARRFSWSFYPAGFFPRLLLRFMHLRVKLLACWLDAAVVLGQNGEECAVLQLNQTSHQCCLEITVKAENRVTESLIGELSYIISRLHMDMYVNSSSKVPLQHEVLVAVRDKCGALNRAVVPFEKCIKAQISGFSVLEIGGVLTNIENIVPDFLGCLLISPDDLTVEGQLGEGSFGIVFKAKMQQHHNSIPVALKELILKDDTNSIYEFQHEIAIMSKLDHKNLVKLYGITKSPLRMVLEFVPMSDLHHILINNQALSTKWKLKLAIDCASGMKYLHAQTPPVCHSDLRAPNVFVASLDEDAEVIGKIADFGLSQQVFSFSRHRLFNIMETAPETWADNPLYDEKSDVFSFAVILWRLFGSIENYDQTGEEDEYVFLKKHGKLLPPPRQREIISKGGRFKIHDKCPLILGSLIQECWQTFPDDRPSFATILACLIKFYMLEYSEDVYLRQRKEASCVIHDLAFHIVPHLQDLDKLRFRVEAWKLATFSETITVTSLLQIGKLIWAGTSHTHLYILDGMSLQIVHKELLNTAKSRIKLLSLGYNCVWVAEGIEIHVFSAKAIREISVPLVNDHTISDMILVPAMFVWVSDSNGYISIWDTKAWTLQKSCRFKVDPLNENCCAQSMALLNNFVWMAAGRDLIVFNTNNLERTEFLSAHKDRIHAVIAVPHTNQVWTCGRDGAVRMWKLDSEGHYHKIKMVHESKIGVPIKSACVMIDGRVCAGSFDGSVYMWDTQTYQNTEIPMPTAAKKHSVQYLMNTGTALWCGFESSSQAIMCHPHQ